MNRDDRSRAHFQDTCVSADPADIGSWPHVHLRYESHQGLHLDNESGWWLDLVREDGTVFYREWFVKPWWNIVHNPIDAAFHKAFKMLAWYGR